MTGDDVLARYAVIRGVVLPITPDPFRAITERYININCEADLLAERIIAALNAGDFDSVDTLDVEYRAMRRRAEALKPQLWKGSSNDGR